MKMKFNKLALAVAVAGTLAAGQAAAHAPGVTPDIEMWMSGASAEDGMIRTLFTELCVSGTLDTYLSNEATPGSSHSAFFCTLDSTKVAGLSITNPKVLFHKRSSGGSGMGVAPVADATPIAHMTINNGNCSLGANPNEYLCTTANAGDTINHVSDGGISDVEPALFVPPNVPSGFSATTPAQLAKLNIQSQVGLVFGIPVTKALRDALQTAQGLTAGAEDEANMPNLSRQQVAALMTGGIKKWDALKVNGTSLTAVLGVTAPSDTKVHICRRVEGSGTQAQMNANFLRVPCTAGANPPLTSSNPVTGPIVTLNSGAGDVDTCLHNDNASNFWSIGLQSLEKNYLVGGVYPKNYRFIKVDGKAPTLANAASNQYFDWAENSIQWLKAANGGPTGDKLVILSKVATDAGKPSIVVGVNAPFVYSWGNSGYLSLNTNGYTGSTPFSAANPVTTATHVLGSVNNCRVPTINKPSELF